MSKLSEKLEDLAVWLEDENLGLSEDLKKAGYQAEDLEDRLLEAETKLAQVAKVFKEGCYNCREFRQEIAEALNIDI